MQPDRTDFLRTGLAAIATALLLQACGPARPAPAPPGPAQVSVVTVHRASVPITVELPGRTTAYLTAQVLARVNGIVLKRNFVEGSNVKLGQQLYQIDPAPYIAALKMQQALLEKSQANLVAMAATVERYKTLVPINAVSQMDYDNAVSMRGQAEADVASYKAAVETARINLGYTKVLSPISGQTGLSMVTEGAYVQASPATPMTTAQQIDPVYVDLTQSSVAGLQLRRDIASGRLKVDGPDHAKVTLLLEDGTEYPLPGRLQFTDISVNLGTGSVTLRAIFPNPKAVLLPGMFVRARIEQGVASDAMLVPQTGVTHDPLGQATALVVGPDGKVAQRTLKVAGTQGSAWIVQSGLNEGDRVIVSGLQKVQPGAAVQATEAPAAIAVAATSPTPPDTAVPQPK